MPETDPTDLRVPVIPSASPILFTNESRPALELGRVVKGVPAWPSKLNALEEKARIFSGRQILFPYLALAVEVAKGSLQVATGIPTLESAVLDDGLVGVGVDPS